MHTALIAGSTGMTGHVLLEKLLADPWYSKVITLVRRRTDNINPKLEELVIDFDQLDKHLADFNSVNHVYCCLGTTIKKAGTREAFKKVDYEYPLELAGISEQVGVGHFLMISAMGADAGSGIFYNRVKGEVERVISKLRIPAITFFRPSLLLGNRKESRPGEKAGIVIAKALSFLMVGPLKNYKAIHANDVAQAMIMEAKDENRKGIKIVMSGEMQPKIVI